MTMGQYYGIGVSCCCHSKISIFFKLTVTVQASLFSFITISSAYIQIAIYHISFRLVERRGRYGIYRSNFFSVLVQLSFFITKYLMLVFWEIQRSFLGIFKSYFDALLLTFRNIEKSDHIYSLTFSQSCLNILKYILEVKKSRRF